MPKRSCFYSFHYLPDAFRAGQVRNIGIVDGNQPARDNDWETVIATGPNRDTNIQNWIDAQMKGRSCMIVLVGNQTAGRKWIKYEIEKSWNEGMGVVGIRIHGLRNQEGYIAKVGRNPFEDFTMKRNGEKMSDIVKLYDPSGSSSKDRYAWISKHLLNAVEEAIRIRKNY